MAYEPHPAGAQLLAEQQALQRERQRELAAGARGDRRLARSAAATSTVPGLADHEHDWRTDPLGDTATEGRDTPNGRRIMCAVEGCTAHALMPYQGDIDPTHATDPGKWPGVHPGGWNDPR